MWRNRGVVISVVALLALGSGCRRIAGYGVAGDAAVDQAIDQAVDIRRPDLLSPDVLPPDLLSPDVLPPDLWCGPPGVATGVPCEQQCGGVSGDQDCDGLPDAFDPAKSSCNAALLIEDFMAPQLDSARWTVGGTPTLGCGALEVLPTSTTNSHSLTLVEGTLLGAAGQGYLVELRFELQQLDVLSTGIWNVAIRTGIGGKEHNCELWDHKDYQDTPGLHINRHPGCGSKSGTWGTAAVTTGQTYVLQSYFDAVTSKTICRILDAAGNELARKSLYNCPAESPDTLRFYTSNVKLRLEHLRVFAH